MAHWVKALAIENGDLIFHPWKPTWWKGRTNSLDFHLYTMVPHTNIQTYIHMHMLMIYIRFKVSLSYIGSMRLA